MVNLPRWVSPAVTARRQIGFASEQRFYAYLERLGGKVSCPKEIAVIGDGDRRHAQFGHPLDQRVDSAGTVEEAETGVEVEVDELHPER